MDRLEPLERQIAKLGERIDMLERNIEYLSSQTKHPVEELLWQHDFPLKATGGRQKFSSRPKSPPRRLDNSFR